MTLVSIDCMVPANKDRLWHFQLHVHAGLHWGGGARGVIRSPPRIWQIHLHCYNSDDFAPPTFLICPPWSKILDAALTCTVLMNTQSHILAVLNSTHPLVFWDAWGGYFFLFKHVALPIVTLTCRNQWWCWVCVRWWQRCSQQTLFVWSSGWGHQSPGPRQLWPHPTPGSWSYGGELEPDTPADADQHCGKIVHMLPFTCSLYMWLCLN